MQQTSSDKDILSWTSESLVDRPMLAFFGPRKQARISVRCDKEGKMVRRVSTSYDNFRPAWSIAEGAIDYMQRYFVALKLPRWML